MIKEPPESTRVIPLHYRTRPFFGAIRFKTNQLISFIHSFIPTSFFTPPPVFDLNVCSATKILSCRRYLSTNLLLMQLLHKKKAHTDLRDYSLQSHFIGPIALQQRGERQYLHIQHVCLFFFVAIVKNQNSNSFTRFILPGGEESNPLEWFINSIRMLWSRGKQC